MSDADPAVDETSRMELQAALQTLSDASRVETISTGSSLVEAFVDARHVGFEEYPTDEEAARLLVRSVRAAAVAFARRNGYTGLAEAHGRLTARLERLRATYDAAVARMHRLMAMKSVAEDVAEIGEGAVVARNRNAGHGRPQIPGVDVVAWYEYDDEDHEGTSWIEGTVVGRWVDGDMPNGDEHAGAPVDAYAWLRETASETGICVADWDDADPVGSADRVRARAEADRVEVDREIEATRLQVLVMSSVLDRPLLNQSDPLTDASAPRAVVDHGAERRRYRAAMLRTSGIFVLGAVASLMGSGVAKSVRDAFDALDDEIEAEGRVDAGLAYSSHRSVWNALNKRGVSATEIHANGVRALMDARDLKPGEQTALQEFGELVNPIP